MSKTPEDRATSESLSQIHGSLTLMNSDSFGIGIMNTRTLVFSQLALIHEIDST